MKITQNLPITLSQRNSADILLMRQRLAHGVGFNQYGFSLIELMIALVLSMLVIAAMIALFLNINRSNEELAKTSSQIENGRFALQVLQQDISHAGFWGEYVPEFDNLTSKSSPIASAGGITLMPATPREIPDPCLEYSKANWTDQHMADLIGIPVQAYANVAPAGGACVTDFSANRKADTDLLIVRHAETCIAGSGGNCDDVIDGELYFQASRSYNQYCLAPEISDTKAFVLSNSDNDFDVMHDKDCKTHVDRKRKFVSNIYYIRDYARTEGDGIPTLMLSAHSLAGGELAHQAAQPLIEGIEGFKVELGIDNLSDSDAPVNYGAAIVWADPANLTSPTNRGDGVPDTFVSCPCKAEQLTNAVVVKLHVLARADKVSPAYIDTKTYQLGSLVLGPFNDGYKRHVFSTTVRINNVAGRRVTP